MDWAGITTAIATGASKIWDFFTQNKQFEYDKEVQQKTWEREDNAINAESMISLKPD